MHITFSQAPKKKRRVRSTGEGNSEEQNDSWQNGQSQLGNNCIVTSESDTDVPDLSTAISDEDSDLEDSDDESDTEAQNLHDESVRRQKTREAEYFQTAPYSPDIFPARNPEGGWRGGRVRGKKPVVRQPGHVRNLFPNESDGDGDDEDGGDANSQGDRDYQPHHRHRKIPLGKKRGPNRKYSSLSKETKTKRLRNVEDFMNHDEDWKLDFARRVFR